MKIIKPPYLADAEWDETPAVIGATGNRDIVRLGTFNESIVVGLKSPQDNLADLAEITATTLDSLAKFSYSPIFLNPESQAS